MSANLTFLENLTLLDLDEIACCADVLAEAGRLAQERGFKPTFTLVPGKPPAMRIDVEFLPHHVEPAMSAPEMEELLEQTRQSVGAAVAAAEQVFAPVFEAIEIHREPAVAPPVAEEAAPCPQAEAADPVSLPDAQHVGQADSTDQGNGLAAAWSAEEDAALIEAMAEARVKGLLLGATARRMSEQLGRTKSATEFRANNKLRGAIHERVRAMVEAAAPKDDADKDQAAEPANEEPGGEPGGLQQLIPAEKAPVQGVVQSAARPLTTPEVRLGAPANIPMEIWLHVEQVPRMEPFTLQVDRDLMRDICAGIPVHVIAGEFDMRPQAIEGRFDILTNRRNFKREKVLQVLDAMLANQVNAKAAE